MRAIKMTLAAVLIGLPVAAGAAELPLGAMHKARHATIHRLHVTHRATPHFGYYWYRWGWRWGGTAHSWYGSRFAFVDGWQ
jgi:hypothetical protein